ncbi:hypothetical protein GH714_011947 [Hevea brasiliensis]|uniref:Transcriptional coactivator Hfi1/Transcriptional adapter 1 n=1 Tax=Hevea brasiliensis TaxID=3981 RepID=A0A6A6K7X7_HEVBR|nr:hypothetical protein GH714_011947 [Hevea brasiliensis]
MQPQQSSRIDLVELKTQIVKKVGAERFKKYFHYLNRFLSQKLSKSDFDRSCFRLLGRENLPLHNQLIRSILKNACQAKIPPPVMKQVPQNRQYNRKRFSWKRRWLTKVDPFFQIKMFPFGRMGFCSQCPHGRLDDVGSKIIMDNGELTPFDYQRPVGHLQAVAEQPANEREGLVQWSSEKPTAHSKDQTAFVEDGEEVEQANHSSFSRSPLLAPLGIPFCSASVGGARKAMPAASCGDFINCSDGGVLSSTEMLRKRMEHIAAVQGVGGVSTECANMLNNMLDVYLKKLIKSSVELVGARSPHKSRKQTIHKQQVQGKVINGLWPSNHLHLQSNSGPVEVMHEQRPRCSISLLDFKVAMELNPQQLGEDWPLLLEKICMQAFEG